MYINFFKFHFRSEGGVMLIKENQIIKATELAKVLGITDRHLRNLANEGVIKKRKKVSICYWKVFEDILSI